MSDNRVFLVYLVDVGRNSATFAIYTHFCGDANREIRAPSISRADAISVAITSLERAAPIIDSWEKLYRWLGTRHGWAGFTPDSAAELLPHWFSKDTTYNCHRTGAEKIPPYIDEQLVPRLDEVDLTDLKEMVGDAESEGWEALIRIGSNLVLTKQPLFLL